MKEGQVWRGRPGRSPAVAQVQEGLAQNVESKEEPPGAFRMTSYRLAVKVL